MRTIEDEYFIQVAFIKKAIEELCAGRTFYAGYFENRSYKDLSRNDRALLLLLEANTGAGELGITSDFRNIQQQLSEEGKKLKRHHCEDCGDY